MGFLQRLAGRLVKKGSAFPFNQIGWGSYGGERLTMPYAKSVWVQRAIKKVAGPIAAVSLQFTSERNGKELVTDPALNEFWSAPAVGLSFTDFIEATVTWLKLAGESFWIFDDVALGQMPFPEAGRTAQQFIVARPDRMEHVTSRGKIAGWRYTDGAGAQHNLLPEQVVHCKLFNPYDPFRGLGELEAALTAAEGDYLAGRFSLNTMRNNGDRGPYIVAKAGIPDEAQQKQIIEALREKRELNQRGIFKPMFLAGDIAVEDPKLQAVDTAFLAQRTADKYEVFLAFGVPPSMADKMESYSVGSASDWYMLIIDTCMPTGVKVAGCIDAVNARFAPQRRVYAQFNWMEHPVMKAVRKEAIDAGVKVWATGMPWKAINEFLELGMPEFAGWEVGYLPFSVAPAGAVEMEGGGDPATDPARGEVEGAAAGGGMTDREREEFLRQVWLGFQRDGTVSDVMANLVAINRLTEQVGLPVNPEYEEPYLPVRDDFGELVSGEVVRDEEGDIVGGASEEDPNEKLREEPGDEPKEEEEKDEPPVEEGAAREFGRLKWTAAFEADPPGEGAPGTAKAVKRMIQALHEGKRAETSERRKGKESGERPKRAGHLARSPLSAKEKARWRELMAKRRVVEKAYQRKFNAELMKARSEVLRKIERAGQEERRAGARGVGQKAAAADFMFSLKDFREGILAGFRKTAEVALQTAGEQLLEEIKRDDPWRVPPAEVMDFVRSRENRLEGVADNVFEEVRAGIQAGLDGGETMEEIAGRVRGQFNEMSRERSMRIAMTETAAAYGVGRQKAMESAGITHKKWLTSGNDNVRPAHAAANGQTVPIEEAFKVGGEELMHPGDPNGSPGNVINCHCVSVAVEAPEKGKKKFTKILRDANGNVIGAETEDMG